MTTEILKTKLETINKKCESTTKLKLDKLYTDVNYDNSKFLRSIPSGYRGIMVRPYYQ